MKRIFAFIVDFFIMQIMVSAIGNIFFVLVIRTNQGKITIESMMVIQFMIVVGVMWLYFFISDYFFSGGSIGKKVIGIKLVCERQKLSLSIALKHSVVKVIACCLWPVTAVYYMFTRRLPYDRWLKLEVVDR